MIKKMTKLEKQIKKHEKLVEEIIADKTKALVRAKRGEYWIKDQQEAYEESVEDYNRSKFKLQNFIEMKYDPFWIRIIPEIMLFIKNPMKYIKYRSGVSKRMIESYWAFKAIKKSWEDDFDYTEQVINEDFKFVEECEAFIEKQKKLLNRGYKVISKQQREQNKND